MGGKSSAPAPPDYSQIAAASEKSAQYAFQMGQDQLQWAKDQYAMDRQVSDEVIGSALDRQEVSDQQAAADRSRYEQIFQPLEEQLAADAQDYASPARKEAAAGRAEADVAQKFQAARSAASQRLEQFGVDPSQTRQGALDLQSRVAEAAAQAGAGNQARNALDAQQLALRSEAINVGRGYPGQIATQYGTALQSGNQAVNTGLSTTASGAGTMGTGTQWQGMGNQGLGIWGSTLNAGYQNQLAQFQANQAATSGVGSLLGAAAGFGASFIPGGSFAAPAINMGTAKYFDEGGEVEYANGGGVPNAAIPIPHDGMAVPPGVSPSAGAAVDDVPANLTAGEFVIPRDVMAWKGQEWAQNEIMKARKQAGSASAAPAQPQTAIMPPQRPAMQTAIPMR